MCVVIQLGNIWAAVISVLLVGSGPEDNVAEYYQQQVEMLEGFNEMDALAERGFIPGMSKVCTELVFICFW